MQTPRLEINALLKRVASNLKSQSDLQDKKWTDTIKLELCILGQRLGYKVCTSSINQADYGEWLYDLCWLEMEENVTETSDWRIKSIPLIVESEWQSGLEIDADFDKLIQSRAKLRLMIFQTRSKKETSIILNRLSERIRLFDSSYTGDEYLIAVINQSDLEINIYEMNGEGKSSECKIV